jgi:hypothetical protein
MTSLDSIRTARLLCKHKQYTDLCSRLVALTSEVTPDLTALISRASFYTDPIANKGWFKTRVTITRVDKACMCRIVGSRSGNYEVLWDITPCDPFNADQCFGRTVASIFEVEV